MQGIGQVEITPFPIPTAKLRAATVCFMALTLCCVAVAQTSNCNGRFEITISAEVSTALTGRMFVFISKTDTPEPRQDGGTWYSRTELLGKDVEQLRTGSSSVLDGNELGYPLKSLNELPSGDYFVQALLNVYTQFRRSDGHVIWGHADQWEGQQFNRSPGNLYGSVQRVHLDPREGGCVKLLLDKKIAPVPVPPDSQWVKHIKIRSELLSRFWGTPIYLGATILLPDGYESHPNANYPVLYEQGHFSRRAPLDFDPTPLEPDPEREGELRWTGEISGYDFYKQWISSRFPRMIVITFQHPTIYFDDSYAVNSANNGPYGDAIMTELIPYIESQYRIIREPYARALSGGSTGGWASLALQIYHPDFFGGVWSFYPDPVDFTRYQLADIYHDENAFQASGYDPPIPERPMERTVEGQADVTVRQMTQLEEVLGSRGRSGQQYDAWEAVYGPTDKDGYPMPLWDRRTGAIDRQVAAYMRDHGYDLSYYLRQHWPEIGGLLVDKLHVYCGDMDNFFLDVSVSKFEQVLESTSNPYYGGTVEYGHPFKGHGWHSMNQAQLLGAIAAHIVKHAPSSADISWRY